MRIRTIKPEFWQHRMHKRISEAAALVALALLSYVDDEGRFEADALRMQGLLFTHRNLSKTIDECLKELEQVKFIALYQTELDGESVPLGVVVNFRRHQVINKAKKSRLPPPPTGTLPDQYGIDTVAVLPQDTDGDGSSPSSETDPLLRSMEGKGKERKERREHAHASLGPSDSDSEKNKTPPPDEPHVPTAEEVIAHGNGPIGVPPDYCRHYHDTKCIKRTWFNPRGELIDWRREVQVWWIKDRHTFGTTQAQKKNGGQRKELESELDEAKAELSWQEDSPRREVLKTRIDEIKRQLGR